MGLDLLDAEMKGPDARIKLKFTSQQVNVTQDSEGRIVDGHPNEVAHHHRHLDLQPAGDGARSELGPDRHRKPELRRPA